MDVFKRVTRGSASKSKEDIRRGKMSESVDVQNPTQIHNHEVEEDQFVGEEVFFLHVLCLAC